MWDLELDLGSSGLCKHLSLLLSHLSSPRSCKTAYSPFSFGQFLEGTVNEATSRLVTAWTATMVLPLQNTSQMS